MHRYFLLLALCFSCTTHPEKEDKTVKVTGFIVEPHTIPVTLEFVGVAESSHPVEIWSRVEGYLDKINYKEGSFVHEGDLLFEIDPNQFEVAVKEAQANLEKEMANLSAAQKSVDRLKPLFEQKAASRKDLDDAMAQLSAEQATVSMYQAKLDDVHLNLGYASIRSPISGMTSRAKYREGTLITPGVNGQLTTVAVLDPIWVNLNISDSYFLLSQREIAAGELTIPKDNQFDVVLTLADGSIYPYHGTVEFVSPLLDPSTGTLGVRAVFSNPNFLLKPGQFVRASAIGATRPNAIIVPQKAVQQGENGRYVYVIKRGKAEMRNVETGSWYKDYWIIKSGLKKGEVVVVDGVNKISPGKKVELIKTIKQE